MSSCWRKTSRTSLWPWARLARLPNVISSSDDSYKHLIVCSGEIELIINSDRYITHEIKLKLNHAKLDTSKTAEVVSVTT